MKKRYNTVFLLFYTYSQGHNNRLEITGLLKFTIIVTSSVYPGGKFRQVITFRHSSVQVSPSVLSFLGRRWSLQQWVTSLSGSIIRCSWIERTVRWPRISFLVINSLLLSMISQNWSGILSEHLRIRSYKTLIGCQQESTEWSEDSIWSSNKITPV